MVDDSVVFIVISDNGWVRMELILISRIQASGAV